MKSKKVPINTNFIPAVVNLAREADKTAQTEWLSQYRQSQIAELEKSNFPTTKVEHFKYNRFDAFNQQNFDQLPKNKKETTLLDINTRLIEGLDNVERVVFVNGQLSEKLSQLDKHQITPFAQANSEQQNKIIAQLNAQNIENNPFTQVCASFADDGILIEITEYSSKNIIEILNIIDDSLSDNTVASHVVIDVSDNSKATVINRSMSWELNSEKFNLSTQRTLVNIGKNGHFTHYSLQLESTQSVYFGSSEYNLQSNATLKAFYGATGSCIKKLDITVNHMGQHAHAFLNGLYAATDNQQIDYHTTINHPQPNGQSDEIFRGIVNGQSTATFNGRIQIFEDAQKTRAELSNKNLVLSDEAVIHTKPELEIYADDVVCAHGATISRMNDASLNYLRARAIPKAEAELMLSYGFFNEVLAEIEHEAVAEYLRPILFKRFD